MTKVRDLSSELRLSGFRGIEPMLAGYVMERALMIYAKAISEDGGHGLLVSFERLDDLFRDIQRDSLVGFASRAVSHEGGSGGDESLPAGQKNDDGGGLTSADDMSRDWYGERAKEGVDSHGCRHTSANGIYCELKFGVAFGQQCCNSREKLVVCAGGDFTTKMKGFHDVWAIGHNVSNQATAWSGRC